MARGAPLDEDRINALAATFSGALLRPRENGYEEARRVHYGLVDKRPALITRCHETADVIDALGLARDSGLEISVRGGGHNYARLAQMKRRYDPDNIFRLNPNIQPAAA